MKIAWKVALATLCILVVFFGAGSCLLISLSFRSALTREVDVAQEELQMLRLSYEAVCVARGITMENMFKEGRSVARVLEENRYFAGRQFRVTTESGRKVYSTMEAASDQELLEEIDDSSRGYSIRRDEKTGRVFIHCADTVTLDNGVLYLESARDITSLFADRAVHYRIYRYLLLAVVSAAVGVLYLTSVWLTRPIRDLGKAANRLAAGDYTSRAEVAGGDEVSELAENFNQMADAVDRVFAPLREHLSGRTAFSEPVRTALDYLEAHYAEKISLSTVAAMLSFSPEHFSRMFVRETGMNFVTCLNNLRMKRAMELLEKTDKKIYEIAEEVGYSSVSYFSTAFKKSFGETPNRYQQTNHREPRDN